MNYKRVEFTFPIRKIGFSEEEIELVKTSDLRCKNSNNIVRLGSSIKSGGEGEIYTVYVNNHEDDSIVAKIYTSLDSLFTLTERKINYIVDNHWENKNVCWPIDTLYFNNKFVGFIMPKVNGKEIYSLTGNENRIKRNYSDYDRLKQVEIVLKILSIFKDLHEHNIIVGDVKLENIMFDVKNDYDITLIDIDSVQIDQFPCVTTTIGYDSPDVMMFYGRKNALDTNDDGEFSFIKFYKEFYRNVENDLYSLAVIIYRLVMFGAFPYCYEDVGLEVDVDDENIEKVKLCIEQSFGFNPNNDIKYSNEYRRALWSYLPAFLKDTFFKVFKEHKIIPIEHWIKCFKKYKEILENHSNNDENFYMIVPSEIAKYDSVNYKLTIVGHKLGFTFKQTFGKICAELKNKELYLTLYSDNKYVRKLIKDKEIKIDNYQFKLIYNIGILKKIEYIEN